MLYRCLRLAFVGRGQKNQKTVFERGIFGFSVESVACTWPQNHLDLVDVVTASLCYPAPVPPPLLFLQKRVPLEVRASLPIIIIIIIFAHLQKSRPLATSGGVAAYYIPVGNRRYHGPLAGRFHRRRTADRL